MCTCVSMSVLYMDTFHLRTYVYMWMGWWPCSSLAYTSCTDVFMHILYCTSLLGRVQGQVTDVMDVMRGNIDKMMQRGERLDNLEEKSGTYILWCKGSAAVQCDCQLDFN